MRYLKKYRSFESLDPKEFPIPSDIEEIFFDITDENIVEFEYWNEGWWYFFYPAMSREVRSLLYDDMTEYPDNWESKKTKVPYQTEWKEMFFDITDPKNSNMIIRGQIELPTFELTKSRDLAQLNKLKNKTFNDLIVDNIIKGKINGIPYFKISLQKCLTENYNRVVECIERAYHATGYRPVPEIWLEDYVSQTDNENVETFFGFTLVFVKCSDKEYKSLTDNLCSRKHEKDLSSLFL